MRNSWATPTVFWLMMIVTLGGDVDSSRAELNIELNFGASVTPDAQAAYTTAAEMWKERLLDDITVNINFELESLPQEADQPITLSKEMFPGTALTFYADVAAALGDDQTSDDDAMAVANLQDGGTVSPPGFTTNALLPITSRAFFVNDEYTGEVFLDDDLGLQSYNNTQLELTTANLKALNVTTDIWGNPTFDDTTVDGTVVLNSEVMWDYDRSNGIDAERYDFVGVAAHEIGHILGFLSGVNFADTVSYPNGPARPGHRLPDFEGAELLQIWAYFTTMDLFRYTRWGISEEDVGIQDGAYGDRGNEDVPYFSIDGGLTALGRFSTGVAHGDGDKPNHWQDRQPGEAVGIMDARAEASELRSISRLDLQLLDVAGYDLADGVVLLQAGDADQDLDFDQLDLVRVQVAAKYLTGQPATWGEGDWNGAPGGSPTNPPAGDGLFNQLDIVAAQQAGIYLTGPYAAGQPNSKAYDGLSFRPGDVVLAVPSEESIASILTAVGPWTRGGDPETVDLVYIPEPSTTELFGLGLVGTLVLRRRRRS